VGVRHLFSFSYDDNVAVLTPCCPVEIGGTPGGNVRRQRSTECSGLSSTTTWVLHTTSCVSPSIMPSATPAIPETTYISGPGGSRWQLVEWPVAVLCGGSDGD
jgi:hypothetical protein